ncbi:MBL fold metallo-hydrolase [Isoptericola aurantiacus]|uniref:MBL fold metallo-hydrolase n=1 Tax=Isoptericola aurantiacus TaxID=3377839 RepID=UPI00383B4B2B
MTSLNIFSHEKKSERHYIFTEGYSHEFRFTIGVVVGDDKIFVVDSGMGMTGDLRTYIESVLGTGKPIVCGVSHGSIDHAGSAMLFDERYCNIRDEWMLLTQAFKVEKRLNDIAGFGLGNPEMIEYGRKHMLDSEGTQFRWIEDGDVFDLGGVQLEVIALPGHSAGSVAYYDREADICFTGDGINHPAIQIHNLDLYYNTPEHRKLMPAFMELPTDGTELTMGECYAKYADVVRRFVDKVGSDVTLYSGHNNLAQTIRTAHNIIEACEEVAAYRIENDMPADSIFEYQKNTPQKYHRVHWAGNTGIVYDAAKFEREAAARATA